MRLVLVYERAGRLLVSSFSQAVTEAWIANKEINALPADASAAELGRAISEGFAAFRQAVKHPDQNEWKEIVAPLLKAACVRSYSQFEKGSICCCIELHEATINIIPTENLGLGEGFVDIEKHKLTVASDCSPEELGRSVRKALDLSIPLK